MLWRVTDSSVPLIPFHSPVDLGLHLLYLHAMDSRLLLQLGRHTAHTAS